MPLWLSFKRGNLKTNIQYPAPLAGPAVAGLVAKGEMHKAAAESGVPRFYFTIFMYFMVKCICSFSCPANSQVSPATAGSKMLFENLIEYK